MSIVGTQPTRAGSRPADAAAPTLLIAIFMLSILPPVYFFVGSLLLTPDRLVMMILFIPMALKFINGQAGRTRACDILMILFSVWIVVTFLYHHGLERLNYSLITVVELLGGYLAGRVLIRSAAAYRVFMKFLLVVLVVLLPIGLVELFTNKNILQQVFGAFMPHYVKGGSSYGRMGLERVMAGFAHPILFGLFCSMALASVAAVFGKGALRWLAIALFVIGMTFMSLSSGPLIAVVVQLGLLLWGKVTGEKWWVLAILTATAYVTVDLLSNRTPITILINYITFNPVTAWTRVNIYTFGIQEVWANPVFGIGLNDWRRPDWLTGSVDNFWLLTAMRHGAVGFVFMFGAMFALSRAIWRARIPSPEVHRWRTGYMIVIMGLFLTLSTVHIWAEVAVFVFFFLGAGVWFTDAATQGREEDVSPPDDLQPSRMRSVGRERPRYVRV